MNDRIQWCLLKRIASDIIRQNAIILASVGEDKLDDVRGAVTIDGERVVLFLNLEFNKGLQDVIDTIAHELAHFTPDGKQGTEHDDEFYKREKDIRVVINDRYQEGILH